MRNLMTYHSFLFLGHGVTQSSSDCLEPVHSFLVDRASRQSHQHHDQDSLKSGQEVVGRLETEPRRRRLIVQNLFLDIQINLAIQVMTDTSFPYPLAWCQNIFAMANVSKQSMTTWVPKKHATTKPITLLVSLTSFKRMKWQSTKCVTKYNQAQSLMSLFV